MAHYERCGIPAEKVEKGVDLSLIHIWGASHQGFTLASTSELGKHLAYIIDSARVSIDVQSGLCEVS